MKSVIKSKLFVDKDPSNLNEKLQKLINQYNEEGLIVKIESCYSASANVGGDTSKTAILYDYILVVGYKA